MEIEYEATFVNVDKDEIRQRLIKIGAKLIKPEFLQKRIVFDLPKGHERKHTWIRVRDEKDKITMSYKEISGPNIEDQKEVNLIIDNFKAGKKFLKLIGCQRKAYQENKRELWKLDGVEICIDEWPFLEPFVEVEGKSEKEVKVVSEKIGFDYSEALFCAVGRIYREKYNAPRGIMDKIPKITFDMENPFLKFQNKNL